LSSSVGTSSSSAWSFCTRKAIKPAKADARKTTGSDGEGAAWSSEPPFARSRFSTCPHFDAIFRDLGEISEPKTVPFEQFGEALRLMNVLSRPVPAFVARPDDPMDLRARGPRRNIGAPANQSRLDEGFLTPR
jgi:hypothetical protein